MVESAGTWTTDGRSVLPVTLKNAERLGLQGLTTHKSRQVNEQLLNEYDLIVTMESGQKEALLAEFKSVVGRVYMLSEAVENIQYDIPDPIVLGLPADDVADELSNLISRRADKILELAQTLAAERHKP